MTDDWVQITVIAASESSLLPLAIRVCLYNAKNMEDLLFSCRSAERTVSALRYFKDR